VAAHAFLAFAIVRGDGYAGIEAEAADAGGPWRVDLDGGDVVDSSTSLDQAAGSGTGGEAALDRCAVESGERCLVEREHVGCGIVIAGLIPVFLDLIAKLLGLGNLPTKVRDVIEAIREVLDKALGGCIRFILAHSVRAHGVWAHRES
jgi:hypothetical protein